jgi:hypothetical protein
LTVVYYLQYKINLIWFTNYMLLIGNFIRKRYFSIVLLAIHVPKLIIY